MPTFLPEPKRRPRAKAVSNRLAGDVMIGAGFGLLVLYALQLF